MFWPVLATVAIIYVCNATLAIRQMRNFSTTYILLRKHGKVAIGKQKNALSRGAIVMFLLDDSDRVVAGRRMNGITVLARFRDFPAFDGLPVKEIDPEAVRTDRGTQRAIANARDNFLTVQAGDVPVEPPTPLMKVVNRVDAKVGHSRKRPAATTQHIVICRRRPTAAD
ncbi:transcriptional regulator [Cutibacterium sp. WCA-380-WT-3A]|uniref:Transcriptional regulator n=1 Tax=Cutibacterium porci TaxID=2605781 RepID=A0A7K0J9D8_9ACTN|nr:transcriptional regulator GutM [Cutibacterium porci]MSS46480.1 transcriptional regulator [Cutibacterium porci]